MFDAITVIQETMKWYFKNRIPWFHWGNFRIPKFSIGRVSSDSPHISKKGINTSSHYILIKYLNIMKLMLQKYKLHMAIILYLLLFFIIQMCKPPFLYDTDGSLKQFGMGYKKKTIFPIWLFSIYLGIICYLLVLIAIKYLY